MEEEKKEEIPNGNPRKSVEDLVKCSAGEATLAIKFRCVAKGPGVEVHLEVATSHPDLGKVPNVPAMYLTLAASNIAKAVKDMIKPLVVGDESIYHNALRKTDDEFIEFAHGAKEKKAEDEAEKPAEEVSDGNE